MRLLLSITAWLSSGVAWAGEREELVVWGDLFARWDDTRWFVSAEFLQPGPPMILKRDENLEFETSQFVVTTVYACNKEAELSERRHEVSCVIEDIALRVALDDWHVTPYDAQRAQVILDEIDAKLTGAAVSLQVADDGRVTNIGLDNVAKDNRRQSEIHETLREVLTRSVVGFHLKMQKHNQLDEGKWLEYNSTIMNAPGTLGSSSLVHHLDRYRGHLLVQSYGKGVTAFGRSGGASSALYRTELASVSIFDEVDGFMVDRVWTLEGKSTASSPFVTQQSIFHAGRVTMLGEADRPDCGPTAVVNGWGQDASFLSAWVPHATSMSVP